MTRARSLPRGAVLAPLAVVACTVLTSPAASAPRAGVSCELLRDPRGDVYAFRTHPTPMPDDALDIVSADVASDDARLTAVLRLADLAPVPPTAPSGGSYHVHLRLSGSSLHFALVASTAPAVPPSFELQVSGGPLLFEPVAATGSVDPARDEVRISVGLDVLSRWRTLTRGQLVTLDAAYTARGVRGEGLTADEALEGTRRYRAGSPSCITRQGA